MGNVGGGDDIDTVLCDLNIVNFESKDSVKPGTRDFCLSMLTC